jgi:hypothetical protein
MLCGLWMSTTVLNDAIGIVNNLIGTPSVNPVGFRKGTGKLFKM